MTESKLYEIIKRKLTVMGTVKLQRIESGSTGLGIPDIFYRTLKYDGWIESKIIKTKLTKPIVVPFRPGQFSWLRDYILLGGTAFLMVYIEDTHDVAMLKNIYIQEWYDVGDIIVKASMFKSIRDITAEGLYTVLNNGVMG